MQGTLTISKPNSEVKRNLGGHVWFPHSLLTAGVSARAFRLYLLLQTYADDGAEPSEADLAAGLGRCSIKTLKRCHAELTRAGYFPLWERP